MKQSNKKSVKAWAVFDTQTKTIARYFVQDGDYMVSSHKVPRRKLHQSYECIPCVITYTPPTKEELLELESKI